MFGHHGRGRGCSWHSAGLPPQQRATHPVSRRLQWTCGKEAGLGLLSPKQSWRQDLGASSFWRWLQLADMERGSWGKRWEKSKRGAPELGPCGPLGHLKDVLRPDHGWGNKGWDANLWFLLLSEGGLLGLLVPGQHLLKLELGAWQWVGLTPEPPSQPHGFAPQGARPPLMHRSSAWMTQSQRQAGSTSALLSVNQRLTLALPWQILIQKSTFL